MNAIMKKTEEHIQALMLTGSSAGLIDKQIRLAHEDCKPIPLEIIKQALAIECRSYGTRDAVVNTLRREMHRQESLMKEAA